MFVVFVVASKTFDRVNHEKHLLNITLQCVQSILPVPVCCFACRHGGVTGVVNI